MRPKWIVGFVVILTAACVTQMPLQYRPTYDTAIHPIDESSGYQGGGDVEEGFDYIYYGDYIGSGYPAVLLLEEDYADSLAADGDFMKSRSGFRYNTFKDTNDVFVINGSCFKCHAGEVNGDMVLGVGDPYGDFTDKPGLAFKFAPMAIGRKLDKSSPEYRSFLDVWQFQKEVSPRIVTKDVGPNPAFRLEESCVAFRHPDDLTYTSEQQFPISGETPASAVPPLWHVAKKKTLYYNGMGRGDFAKLFMQASVLGIKDSTFARQVHSRFDDVVAWAASIEPPPYPEPIDEALSAVGREVFKENCSKCHGTYDTVHTYPNKILPLEKVGTDPYYALYFYEESGLTGWYNQSWFAASPPMSALLPSLGYVAPPLDGIWATAPYLHNGSVPTLLTLLDSSLRPSYWERDTLSKAYNFDEIGLSYEVRDRKAARKKTTVYNTDRKGFGHQGHTFGDHLSTADRQALLEYLKTL